MCVLCVRSPISGTARFRVGVGTAGARCRALGALAAGGARHVLRILLLTRLANRAACCRARRACRARCSARVGGGAVVAILALAGARVARLLGGVLLDQVDLLVRVAVNGHAQPLERRTPVMEREERHLWHMVAA